FKDAPNRKQLSFTSINPVDWVKSIYHLSTCHKIFVDNYYGFLAVTVFKPNTECIQLWHAAGAIKQFGLKDLSIENRSAKASERFKPVSQRCDPVAVRSEKMAPIFNVGFGISDQQILRTGVSRTVFFVAAFSKEEVGNTLEILFPLITE